MTEKQSLIRVHYEPWPECFAYKGKESDCKWALVLEDGECYFLCDQRCTCTDAIVEAHEKHIAKQPKGWLSWLIP